MIGKGNKQREEGRLFVSDGLFSMGGRMQEDTVMLKNRLLRLYDYFSGDADAASAHKVRQLAEKLVRGEFGVAFCGHFSAGNSRFSARMVSRG